MWGNKAINNETIVHETTTQPWTSFSHGPKRDMTPKDPAMDVMPSPYGPPYGAIEKGE